MYKKQIVLILIALSATFIFDNVRAASTLDSLEQVLARLPDSARLIKLNDLAYQNPDDYSYKIYAEKLLKEAEQQKNNKYLGNAYFLLIKYHYSGPRHGISIHMNNKKMMKGYLVKLS